MVVCALTRDPMSHEMRKFPPFIFFSFLVSIRLKGKTRERKKERERIEFSLVGWLVGNVRFYLSDHDPFKILRVELMAPKVTCIFPLPYFPVAPFVCCSQSRGPFQKQLERRKSPNKVRQPHKIYLTTATLTWILFGHVTNSSRLDASLSFSLLPHYLFHLAPTSQPATRPATRPTDRLR